MSATTSAAPNSPVLPARRAPEVGLDLLATAISDEAIFLLDVEGLVVSWSPGAERIKGYRNDEIIGRHFSVFYPPERAGHAERELERAARKGYSHHEGWRVRKDGSRFWADVVITALRSPDGTLRGFAKITRDETESHTRLERSSRRFTNLFDLAPFGFALFDESHRLVRANDALRNLLTEAAWDGVHADDLLHPQDASGPLIPETGITEAIEPVDRILRRADGSPVYCDLRCTPTVEDDGRFFWLVAFQDITDRHHRAEELRYLATHDELTGLLNRRAVTELLEELVRGSGSEQAGVLFCDINNFKRINDSLGHDAGDELVVALARTLSEGVPEGCTPARLSGDEFVVVCRDVEAVGGLEALATTVSGLFRTTVRLQGRQVKVSAAIGGAVLDDTALGGADLLRFADAAMYQAKQRGLGRVALADHDLTASIGRQLRMEEQLREAIDDDELEVYFQPIVDAEKRIISAESLVRWRHPELGVIGPGAFIPVAEQGGLMRDLDRWVLRTALRQAASWPEVNGRPLSVAVNLAGLLPDDPGFTREITATIAETGIDPNRVVLELVETMLVDLPDRPRRAMLELTERGIRFAVDDFGTGYSSLARIKDLPAQILKADRSFVADLGVGSRDLAVAQAVADFAGALGCRCVAEGVETTEQFELLTGAGVNAFQGFLFSHPVPATEFGDLLRRGIT